MDEPTVLLLGAPLRGTASGELPLVAERRDQLLAYLACRGEWVTRDALAALFWPERSNASARSNLRYVLLQLRRTAIEGLQVHADSLRLCADADLPRFEQAIAASDWSRALGLYRGPLLLGMENGAPPAFAEWLLFERTRLEASWRRAVAARLDELAAEPAACAALARRVLAADPLDEPALAAWLRAAHALAGRDEALAAFDAYERRIGDELGIEPAAALRDLAALLRDARAAPAAPAAAVAAAVVAAATAPGFVGRRAELAQLAQLLSTAGCRVLTVLGAGGVGKTALAQAAVPIVAPHFAGVFWVALGDLETVDQVAPRLAAALAIAPNDAEPVLAQVIGRLREKALLVVLDSAEHLGGFDELIATLVRECPAARFLVTSRVRLATAGEWLLPLDGLAVPDADETEFDALAAFDAVRLFDLRARAAEPTFDLRAHAADVAALARLVEGLPLALELAAARVRLLPMAAIALEIARSLDAIEPAAASVGVGARTRSLRASFDHSWRLLAPAERGALAGLAVFPGAFSHEAARFVADATLPLLAALVDKSLVRADGNGRFSLHALIRQCALERLDEQAAFSARARHQHFFTRWLARYGDFDRIDAQRALTEIELELVNCRAAWEHTPHAADPDPWARRAQMADPLKRFFELSGRAREGVELFSGAAAEAPPQARGRVLHALSFLQIRLGLARDAEGNARGAVRLLRAARDAAAAASALNTLGLALWKGGRIDSAGRCFERALRDAQRMQLDAVVAHATNNLAIIERVRGHYERAAALYRQGLEAASARHDGVAMARAWNNIGDLNRARGDWGAARQCFEQALHHARSERLRGLLPPLLVNLALARLELGEPAAGKLTAQEALSAARAGGDLYGEASALAILARVAVAARDDAQAQVHLREALQLARAARLGMETALIDVRAEALAARGEREAAAAHWCMLAAQPDLNAEDRRRIESAVARLSLDAAEVARARELAAGLDVTRAGDALLAP